MALEDSGRRDRRDHARRIEEERLRVGDASLAIEIDAHERRDLPAPLSSRSRNSRKSSTAS
ncbi:hypothetical protein [Anaeromyxobacter sp. Fw109-5]|uniref:hypothetical protein n=1 Tax=Anaeromyxobacter sp. (strain Fw109-5) TaxID=404589 RepID=UPI00117C4B36|nr:hypothetical protein [Anaeromyxobacter sp. Fw109-5]